MIRTTLDGHTIERRGGSYCGPEHEVALHAGVKSWILIDGERWYGQSFRNARLLMACIKGAELLTLSEWLKLYEGYVKAW